MAGADGSPAGAPARRGRVAAWVALAGFASAVGAFVWLTFDHPLALPFLAVVLLAAGGSGWLALTRRGVVGVIGLAGLVVALVGGGAALVAVGAVRELAVFVVGVVVFFSAERRAVLALRQAEAGTPRPRVARRGAPRRAVLLLNPRSGDGTVARFDLAREAKRRSVDPVVVGPGDDLVALAAAAVRDADVIGMAGGDGSQALVAEIAAAHQVPFVCVPAGTRNHLALDLGLDRRDVAGALDGFTDRVERSIDIAYVNNRAFVNNVSLGVYAQIVQSNGYRNAKLRTIERQLPELLGPDAEAFDLRFTPPDGRDERSAPLVLVSNNPYVLDRIGGFGFRPRLDTGELGVVAVEISSAADAAKLVSLEAVGEVRRYPGWVEWSTDEFEVRSGGPVAAGIDGEAVMLDPPLRFRVQPLALRVWLPASAPGVSPAAMTPRLTRDSLRELGRVATNGR
jgi:diacylglycerol kinase family enzyme